MALPNFICVGAEKAGTTPLGQILTQHRDVYVTPNKETHYFSRFYGRENFAFYETYFFRSHNAEKMVGELTPDYMRYRETAERLKRHLAPGLKLIFCLREPVARAFSHYLHSARILEENESFETAIGLERLRLEQNYYQGTRRSYVGGSLYVAQIRRFLEHFPRENMFFMVLEEDFAERRAQTIGRLFDFLDVGADPAVKLEVRNTSLPAPRLRIVREGERAHVARSRGTHPLPAGAVILQTGNVGLDRVISRPSPAAAEFFSRLERNMTRDLPPELAGRLHREYFHDEIGRLEELVGRDLSVWRRQSSS